LEYTGKSITWFNTLITSISLAAYKIQFVSNHQAEDGQSFTNYRLVTYLSSYSKSSVAFYTIHIILFPFSLKLAILAKLSNEMALLFYCTPLIVLFLVVMSSVTRLVCCSHQTSKVVSLTKSLVWGPGLDVDVVLPVRYFFIQPVDTDGNKYVSAAMIVF